MLSFEWASALPLTRSGCSRALDTEKTNESVVTIPPFPNNVVCSLLWSVPASAPLPLRPNTWPDPTSVMVCWLANARKCASNALVAKNTRSPTCSHTHSGQKSRPSLFSCCLLALGRRPTDSCGNCQRWHDFTCLSVFTGRPSFN